jgi:lipid A 3-O-deacylase
MKRIFLFTALLLFLIPSWGHSDGGTPSSPGAFSFYIENDTVAGTDRDYTSGLKLNWTSRWIPAHETDSDGKNKKGWVPSALNRLPFFNTPGDQRALSILIGQDIYTPENLKRSDLIPDDRPYAGYTYLGFAVQRTAQKIMDTIELDIGMVGPHSYAQDVQEQVHKWLGNQEPQGWKNQLQDEFTLELIYERKWKLGESKLGYGFGHDFIPHLGGRFGNANISANAGAELRFGWNPPGDFGTCPIRPGCESNAASDLEGSRRHSFGIHAFLSIDGRAVLRDIFLDGNTWEDSPNVDKNYFVADLGAGLGMSTKLFKLTYGIFYRTKEFKTQNSNGQVFGSLLITFFL